MMKAIRPHKPRVLVWPPNIRGENGKLIRLVGGIPIPDESVRATESYIKAIKKLLEGGGWLHVYAEGSMWEYYAPIRPFKRGIGYFSCRFGKPVLPIAFSYRKPGFIRKKIFKQKACLTLTVGEPIFPNGNLALKERERDMVERCHKAVRELAGITEEENMYPPVFDKNERIDYYAAEYGVKDKK